MKIRGSGRIADIAIRISRLKKGKDLKSAYVEKQEQAQSQHKKKVRLFCVGREIEDAEFLYKYDLANDFVLIALYHV